MKKYYSAILIMAAMLLTAVVFQKSANVVSSKNVPQDLQNEKAIESLKKEGSYDSLLEVIKDVSAERPSAIESIFVQNRKLTAFDGTINDAFGNSVAISGDTIIIAADKADINGNELQGTAYIFVRIGPGWARQTRLVADDGADGDEFGTSVAVSGDTAIVGARGDDFGSETNAGAAYVFVRSGASWTQQAKLVANVRAQNDSFGDSVAISGDTVIVGAPGADAAYVFVRNGSTWGLQEKLTPTDGAPNETFGDSVAVAGSTALVGAPSQSFPGSAYVFVRNGTNWTQQVKLAPNDSANQDSFGVSVDLTNTLSGAIAVIGAYGINSFHGAAYVFARSQLNVWSQTQKLIAADGGSVLFGVSVSIAPTTAGTIIIGSDQDAVGSNFHQGSAYIFKRAGSIWTQQQRLIASDGADGDFFGKSVSISGETAIIGAEQADVSFIHQGAAYTFEVGATSPFDFDGDGKTDISIFRPSNGQWWYYRSSDGGNYAATFGTSTDKLVPGDFTGDGKTDIALFRPVSGEWFILRSEDGSYYSFPFGTNGDLPAVGDFDADGKADSAVFRPSTVTWYIRRSTDGGTTIQQFGASNDVPAVADYDGDGKADIAIYRPSLGQWWIQRSTAGTIAFTFGNSNDKPVQGDYTGDGKADVAIWRPSTGEWFILRSENQSYYSFPFGTTGDIPAPGDFDGDGKFDATVFRPSGSTWYVQRSTAGTLIQSFGISGDKPVPNAFIN